MMKSRSLDLPFEVARGFVNAMNSYFAAEHPHKQDAIAAHQLGILGRYQTDTQERVAIFDLIKNRMGLIDNQPAPGLRPLWNIPSRPRRTARCHLSNARGVSVMNASVERVRIFYSQLICTPRPGAQSLPLFP